jgi:hypothetical protein
MKRLAALLALVLLTSCSTLQKLPDISGDSFDYSRKDPLGGTIIHAEGVVNTAEYIQAAAVTWNTTYPQWSVSVSIKNYKQLKPKTQ